MKKQQYTSPAVEIVEFENRDPITTSYGTECGGCSTEVAEMDIGSE